MINVLVRTFEELISWIVEAMDSLCVLHGRRIIVGLVLEILESADRLLLMGKRYLDQVRRTLRFRLHFEAVTAPMRARYKELKRR
jgi:hypothetical protein